MDELKAKLQQVLDTKANLKVAINNKGGHIGNATPFSDYVDAIYDIKTTIESDGIKAIPNDDFVGEVYFDKELTTKEVDDIISSRYQPP